MRIIAPGQSRLVKVIQMSTHNAVDSLYDDAIGSQIFWLYTEFAVIKNKHFEQRSLSVQIKMML